jgi:hypothetical protein
MTEGRKWIRRLEATDLNFEFVFATCLRQDESGEKGIEKLKSAFLVERECPQNFPQN